MPKKKIVPTPVEFKDEAPATLQEEMASVDAPAEASVTNNVVAKPGVDSEINFVYTITNNGNKITKDFKGIASPQDVILSLWAAIIGDVKTNLEPDGYEDILSFLVTQRRAALTPAAIIEPTNTTPNA